VKETNRALEKPTVHERDGSADSGRILQRGPPILTCGLFFLCVSQMAPFQYSSVPKLPVTRVGDAAFYM